jgi:hypothetical protein
MRLRSEIIWTVGLLLLIVVILLATTIGLARMDKPENRPLYLSYGRHPRGVKAFAKLLEVNGYQVRSLRKSFGQLPPDADLLILFPASPEVMAFSQNRWTEKDEAFLEKWLRAGGRLMILEGDGRLVELNPVYDSGSAPPAATTMKGGRFTAKPLIKIEWLKGVQAVEGKDFGGRLAASGDRWVPLLADGMGVTMALRFAGKGVVLESTDADMLTNEWLRKAQNGHFALTSVRFLLPKGGTVYFDDAGQGDLEAERAQGFWTHVPGSIKLAYTHLLLLAGIMLYSLGKRFGLPRPSRIRAPAMGEYVTALAQLYQNAQATHAALSVIGDQARRDTARKYGLPGHYTLLQLIEALPTNVPARQVLQRAHTALQKQPLSEEEALAIARELSRLS